MNAGNSGALGSPRVRELLERLFAESRASNAKTRELFGAMSKEERARRMSDPSSDFREFYGRARDLYLAVSEDTARLLYVLARTSGARAIVEFGTSFGISTIHLAAALRDNGGGRLVGSELLPSKVEQVRANLAAAGLDDLCDIREGDAQETLARDLPATIDLVLMDGHKALYPAILDLLEPRLRPGACIVADNASASPGFLERMRAPGGGYVSVAFEAGEVEVSVKI